MKNFFRLFGITVLVVVIGMTVAGCRGNTGNRPAHLVGAWDWVDSGIVMMSRAFELNSDGTYSWLGVDYGAMGSRWSSNNGVVSFTLLGVTTQWFRYTVINANTLTVEYFETPGITYTIIRAE